MSLFNRSIGSVQNSSTPITITNDRSVDAAYASYIIPNLSRGPTGIVSSLDMGHTVRDNNFMTVSNGYADSSSNSYSNCSRDSDQSLVKVQTQTPPRNSTLRAAAAPFQPATSSSLSLSASAGSINCSTDTSINTFVLRVDPFALTSVRIDPAALAGTTNSSDIVSLDTVCSVLAIKADQEKIMAAIGKQSSTRQSQPKQQPQQLQLVRGTLSTSSTSASTSLSSSSRPAGARGRANSSVGSSGAKNSGAFHTGNLSQAYMMGKRDTFDTSSYDLLNCSVSSSEKRRNNEKGREEWEAAMEAEVSEASEHVWRQVENWIEAEAMAEEAAWDVLVLGHDNDPDENDNEDEERYMGDDIDCLDGDTSGKLMDADSDLDSAPAPTSGSPAMRSMEVGALLAGDRLCSSGEDPLSFVSQSLLNSNSAVSLSADTSTASSPTASNSTQNARNSSSPRSGSPVSSSSTYPVGINRYYCILWTISQTSPTHKA